MQEGFFRALTDVALICYSIKSLLVIRDCRRIKRSSHANNMRIAGVKQDEEKDNRSFVYSVYKNYIGTSTVQLIMNKCAYARSQQI